MRASEENQQKILEFIRREIEDKGYPPSVREICAAVGLKSTSTVHAHLNNLEKKGLISLDYDKPLRGFSDEAYAAYPIRGSMGLTERGWDVLEMLEYQGILEENESI